MVKSSIQKSKGLDLGVEQTLLSSNLTNTVCYLSYIISQYVVPGDGTRYIKKVGMLVETFEIDPLGRPIWASLAHFLTPKRD